MAKESRNDSTSVRTSHAAVPKAAVAQTVPIIAATPVERYEAPAKNGLFALVDGLAAASPQLGSFLEKRQEEQDGLSKAEAIEAANRENAGNESNAIANLNDTHRTQSPVFQKQYMAQSGINDANALGRNLSATYDTWSAQNPNGNLEEFINANITQQLQGMDDADYKQAFLETLAPMETTLRQEHTKRVRSEVDASSNEMAHDAYVNLFSQTNPDGSFKEVAADDFSVVAEEMNKLGISNAELNKHIYEAAVRASLPDAQGIAHPEVFDSLMGTSGVGGSSLGNTGDYGQKIVEAQLRAQGFNKKAKAVLSNTLKADTHNEITLAMEDPNFVWNPVEMSKRVFDSVDNPDGDMTFEMFKGFEAKEKAKQKALVATDDKALYFSYEAGINNGTVTADMLITDSNLNLGNTKALVKLLDAKEIADTQSGVLNAAIDSGRLANFADVFTNKERQDAFDAKAREFLSNTDPENPSAGFADVIHMSEQNGKIFTPWLEKLNTANPRNASAWKDATSLYQTLKENHPSYLGSVFTNSHQRALFDAYDSSRNLFGMEHEEASQSIANLTPEDTEIANNAMKGFDKSGGQSYRVTVSKKVQSGFATGNVAGKYFEQSARNGKAMESKVNSYLKTRLAISHDDLTGALVDEAIEAVRSQHTLVAGQWVAKNAAGANTPGLTEAVEGYMQDMMKETLGDRHDRKGYRLVPDDRSENGDGWLVTDSYGVRVLDGNGASQRILPEDLIKLSKRSEFLTPQEAVAANIANTHEARAEAYSDLVDDVNRYYKSGAQVRGNIPRSQTDVEFYLKLFNKAEKDLAELLNAHPELKDENPDTTKAYDTRLEW